MPLPKLAACDPNTDFCSVGWERPKLKALPKAEGLSETSDPDLEPKLKPEA